MRNLSYLLCAVGVAGCSLDGKLFSVTTGIARAVGPTSPSPARRGATPPPLSQRPGVPASAPVAALPEVPAGPAPATYAWCKTAKSAGDLLDRALTDEDPDRAVPAIVDMLCFPDGDAKAKRNALETRRQHWMKRLGMTEADWATDVVDWSRVSYSIRNTAHVDPTDGAAWSSAGAVEQFALLSMHTGDSKAFAMQAGAKLYMADAFTLTQAGRIALIADCIHTNSDNEVNPIDWAICQPDIDALDPTKLGAELRADTQRSPYDRMVVRAAYANLQPTLVEHAAKVKTLLAKDEVYGKLFAIAKATHAEWASQLSSRASLLALVSSLDDARATGSQKAIAGCSDKAWPAFTAVLAKIPAKEFNTLFDSPVNRPILQTVGPFLRDADAYLAANALVACEADRGPISRTLGPALATWSGFRGPHTATESKLRIANLKPDRRGEKLEYTGTGVHLAIGGGTTNPGSGSGTSVITKISSEGDVVHVEFVKTSEMQTHCGEWRKTNRIQRILDNGQVMYESECVREVTKREDTTVEPVTIAKRYVAGVVPGALMTVTDGVPVATWKKGSTVPVTVFGVAVK